MQNKTTDVEYSIMDDSALVVIDIQNALFEGTVKPYQSEFFLSNVKAVLAAFRSRNLPVIYVQHTEGEDFREHSHGWQIYPQIAPQPNDMLVKKTTWDAFYLTNLDDLLIQRQIGCPVFVGMQTEYCFDTTVRSSFAHGYRGILLSDAHTAFDSGVLPAEQIIRHHNSVLCGRFAEGMTTEEFLNRF